MRIHPALSMLALWLLCAAAFSVLPFQMLGAKTQLLGFVGLAIFLGAFVAGSLLVPARTSYRRRSRWRAADTALAERVLSIAAAIATCLLVMDVRDKSLFDLVVAYELRSAAADALLHAEQSASSIWFQAGFLFYPAAFPLMALHIIHRPRIRWLKVLGLGVLPVLLATLSMGGRAPLMYALVIILLSLSARRHLHPYVAASPRRRALRMAGLAVALVVVVASLFAYFSAVFAARASLGDSGDLWATAEGVWNVGFKGPLYPAIEAVLGEGGAYQLFAFSWYFLQGIVMSNFLFSGYDGPIQLGIYGIDIASAVMRRLDPDRVASGFNALMTLGTYGFLPSAWGSLFVDLHLGGVLACVAWGAFAAWAWRRTSVEKQARWLTVAPFVTIGIMFSLVNTPLGFNNGFVTHLWLLLAFLLTKPARARGRTSPPPASATPFQAAALPREAT